jgi:hypothetical protein
MRSAPLYFKDRREGEIGAFVAPALKKPEIRPLSFFVLLR